MSIYIWHVSIQEHAKLFMKEILFIFKLLWIFPYLHPNINVLEGLPVELHRKNNCTYHNIFV